MAAYSETALRGEVEYMRHATESVRFIVIHCSATRCDRPYTAEQLERDHLCRGFRTTGYHFYIRTDGTTTHPRLLGEVGAHVKGLNHCSIGICYEGGLDPDGHPADTRTPGSANGWKNCSPSSAASTPKPSSPATTASTPIPPRLVLASTRNGSIGGFRAGTGGFHGMIKEKNREIRNISNSNFKRTR